MRHPRSTRRLAVAMAAVFAPLGPLGAEEGVDFQRDVRPILSSACFECHGPDEEHREADLRLDTRDGLREGLIVPGSPDESELFGRITATDEYERMPPPDSGKQLSEEQIEVLRKWIAAGAAWGRHWAFEPPRRPPIPDVDATGDTGSTGSTGSTDRTGGTGGHDSPVAHPIDAFVRARLRAAGLTPSPPAPPETLVRRLFLDLIGLPPTIEQADEFLRDPGPEGYRALVERLLSSPHYGEKWARHWLDAARYADSDGFEKDKPRHVWMYRDWVIGALNRDLPYDRFVIEQIAGDLLPDPTQDQLVATGFLRNSMLNEEGGIDPEQFRMEAMFDRMDAVGKAVLGVTIQCAQCHNHKYDPLTQAEYYRMFAFLNNSHEGSIAVYPGERLARRERLLAEIRAVEEQLKARMPEWKERVQDWMDSVRGDQPQWTVLEIHNANDNAQRYTRLPDGSLLAQGYAPTRFNAQFTATTDLEEIRAFRIELLTDPTLPAHGPGRATGGLCALTEFRVDVRGAEENGKARTVKLTAASADFANEHVQLGPKYGNRDGSNRGFTGPADYAIDGKDDTAWGIDAGPGRRNSSRKAVFQTGKAVAHSGGMHLRFHLIQKHGGYNSDDNQTMNLGRFRISATGVKDAAADPLPADVREIIESGVALSGLEEAAVDRLFSWWRTTVPEWAAENARIEALWEQHPEGTTQLVLAERERPRQTHVLERGDFLKPQDPVPPGVPDFLHPLECGSDVPTRLDFARWLVDRESPTTARAIVNRVWQAHFGVGLVETSEDLGSQGAAPSHPDLLDWLAVEFMEHGWSLKWLHRQIVSSATYQQSSRVTPAHRERDPANRLLARGPRFRLDAELVRDVALAASGLLDRTVGGPGVYPPAPEFLFQPPASYGPKTWEHDEGPDKYRRGLYTFRFRSVPYPPLTVFDAPPGDFSCTRRSRSNTPLQALTTLNEPLFVECAQALAAELLQREGSDTDRLESAFRRCLTRAPNPDDRDILLPFLEDVRTRLERQSPEQLKQLAGIEEHEEPPASPAELAAWTALCRVILNLDETITRE